jgi:hypothetical protein
MIITVFLLLLLLLLVFYDTISTIHTLPIGVHDFLSADVGCWFLCVLKVAQSSVLDNNPMPILNNKGTVFGKKQFYSAITGYIV